MKLTGPAEEIHRKGAEDAEDGELNRQDAKCAKIGEINRQNAKDAKPKNFLNLAALALWRFSLPTLWPLRLCGECLRPTWRAWHLDAERAEIGEVNRQNAKDAKIRRF